MNIDKAIQRYNKLASRRDGRINVPALNEIAAKLAAQVPAGERNDVDLLLGRPAELPERVEYFAPDPNSPREILARQQRADMDDETILKNWPLCSAACQIRRERFQANTRPATDTAAATEAVTELAQAKQSDHDAYLEGIADQYADMLDWHRMCGDLAI